MTTLIAGTDIGTTGLDWTEGHRIIEVAAVIYDLTLHRGRIRSVPSQREEASGPIRAARHVMP
ncbi:hypothetical protein ACFQ3P_38590 [Paraburkholderia sabiae]|uniref:Uncharacterized protein n=1 Tax=Paraburkholderia sabiae TaxID=273251 RepID=A0ABU9QPY1_9BURK|nr:hypothetical protein [Paraburkholderia sabiae]WJZ74380.1 hypothetical protein QEN71_00765 [Paraburkholderia sabiae]CAD6562658.1 hypothetical protein LMG24235_07897 [Paraburkholderia sabiae]